MLELIKLYEEIKKGKITKKELETYSQQANELQVLYGAANIGSTLLIPQFTEVSSALKVCVKKFNTVEDYRLKLVAMVDYCKHLSKGMIILLAGFNNLVQQMIDTHDNEL